jgi:hypothetical protein
MTHHATPSTRLHWRLSKAGFRHKAITLAPTMKCPLIRRSSEQRSESHTNCKPPANRNTLSPGLTSSKQDPPVLVETEVTAFSGDYHQPAAPKRYATVKADLRVVHLTDRFSHQQVIHIPSTPQTSITKG